jgi:hypothetical protein
MNAKHHIAVYVMALTAAVAPVHADSDGKAFEQLRLEIEGLRDRVTALESLTTFTTFMPNFAERFHIMHNAGTAQDWAVASHELNEMQRMAKLSTSIDGEKGRLLNSMMAPHFAALDDAIEHGNGPKFEQALVQAITTCNACHAATGSGFIEVTLEVPDLLNMRHPHKLTASGVPEGHAHEMPAAGTKTMHDTDASGGHDDAGKTKHKD